MVIHMKDKALYIDRPMYVDKIMAYVDAPFIKILTGIRRCGKSTMLKIIMDRLHYQKNVPKERIVSFRFDSMLYEDMTAKQMYEELKSKLSENGKTYFFLDEIQEVNGWERVVNSLASDYDVDIYITGSNSRMMSSEISTYLTGRYLTFKRQHTPVENPRTELANYICLGGFPAVHLQSYSSDEVYTIVRDIYNSTVFLDIVRRSQIRKVDQLERIIKFTFHNMGNTFSAKTISDYLKAERRALDNETVYNYLQKLEGAYLLHRCSRYDLRGKEILKTQEKFYLADTSLRYSVLGYQADTYASSLENIVYLELCRRGYRVFVGKTEDGEIDFVAERLNEKIYVQVTQKIESEKTMKREYERLLSVRDNYPKYVLRTDEFAGGNYEGIKTMHVADFLLSGAF